MSVYTVYIPSCAEPPEQPASIFDVPSLPLGSHVQNVSLNILSCGHARLVYSSIESSIHDIVCSLKGGVG